MMEIIVLILVIIVLIIVIQIYYNKIGFNKTPLFKYRVNNYDDLLNNNNLEFTSGGITKIIIKTSWQSTNEFPQEIIDVLEINKTLNPDWDIYYFDNIDTENFMKDYSIRTYNAYMKIIPGAFKADLFRYCILEKYGGCYSDIGHVMTLSFDDICEDNNLVIVKDIDYLKYEGIHNALICSSKNSIFMKKLIDKCCENIENDYYGVNSLDITGPGMMGKIYNCFFKNFCEHFNKDLIKIGNEEYNNFKIKILYLDKNFFGDDVIKDKHDNIILKIKFKNYYKIMYADQNVEHYSILWNKKKVYDIKIDIVYTWVNGKDQIWKDRKYNITGIKSDGDKLVENVDEIKYSLMSVFKYAPWVNNIYIVVDDVQKPNFEHHKIKIIKHSEIIETKYLPTYNSLVIEANIHHIPNLSENFLYFNDDMFLGNYISKDDILDTVYGEYKTPSDINNAYNIANFKNYKMLKSKFSKIKPFLPWHQVLICKRSLMYELETIFQSEYNELCKHKIRKNENEDFYMIGLQQMYGLYNGKYNLKKNISNVFVEMANKKEIFKLNDIIKNKPKFFCINNIQNVNDTLKFFNSFLIS